jgi:hypothetical protein
MRSFIIYSFLLLFVISCLDRPDCVEKRNNIIGITFKDYDDGKALKLQVDTIIATGAEVAFISPSSTSQIFLPLDYLNDTTYYTIDIADTTYTLNLAYNMQTEFISEDCGERYALSSLAVANHTFDSVHVVSNVPGVNTSANNIVIFFK